MERFKFLEHTADIKFQAFGTGLEECFSNSAYALKEIITEDKIKPVTKKIIKISGKDYENLLYNFLEEFLFLLDSSDLIVSEIKNMIIKRDKDEIKLTAVIYFDNIKKYKTIGSIKAVTYNDMSIKIEKNKTTCQVVLDI